MPVFSILVANSRGLGGDNCFRVRSSRAASVGCLATMLALGGCASSPLRLAGYRPTMDSQRGSLLPRDGETPEKEIQLRVTPLELKFLDALAGKVYRLPITVHNLGRCNQKIRFQEPAKPQVTHSGVLEQSLRSARALRTPPHLGTCLVRGSRHLAPSGMGAGLSFQGSGDLGDTICVCSPFCVCFIFPWCWETGWGKGNLEPPNFFILGLERAAECSTFVFS